MLLIAVNGWETLTRFLIHLVLFSLKNLLGMLLHIHLLSGYATCSTICPGLPRSLWLIVLIYMYPLRNFSIFHPLSYYSDFIVFSSLWIFVSGSVCVSSLLYLIVYILMVVLKRILLYLEVIMIFSFATIEKN